MEIVAMDMKVSCHGNEGQLPLPNTTSHESQSIICDIAVFFLCQLRGMYAARQLSFAGVNFDIKDVPLSEKFVEMYDASVELVSLPPNPSSFS